MAIQRRELVLGGPGCGKTTRLLQIVEKHIESGVPINEIAYVAFTRKAASEAKERACRKFGYAQKDLPFFRTLHSFSYQELGIAKEQLMTNEHYDELGEALKLQFGTTEDEFGAMSEQRERGSQYYHIEQQARLRCMDLKAMSLQDGRHGYWHVQHYKDSLDAYKGARKLLDYTDILQVWLDRMEQLPIQVLIIDEAQDLSPLQWKLIHKMEKGVPFIYYAGDDDQAIYQWAGADIDHFLQLDAIKTVLPVSYRLPVKIFNKCDRISKRIKYRYAKNWRSTDREGSVSVVGSPEQAALKEGRWMVLARNHYHLDNVASFLKTKGHVYSFKGFSSLATADALAVRAWLRCQPCDIISVGDIKRILSKFPKNMLKTSAEGLFAMSDDLTVPRDVLLDCYGIDLNLEWVDVLMLRSDERAYIKAAFRMNPDLDETPRIQISTIHAVKGGECDNVLLLPDMSTACYDSFIKQPDAEARVFYTGCSRAKERLVLVQPQSKNYFPL